MYSIPPPSESDTTKKQAIKVKRGVMSKVGKKVRAKTDEEVIDVSYDTEVKEKKMNIEDSDVKDRWSRYIGAMGIDAVARQANASVFMSGLGPLGVEIAKNIVLSGVKRFTLHDNKKADHFDLAG